jgi:hypothetical protein
MEQPSQPLLISPTPDHYQAMRPLRRKDHNPIPSRYFTVLSYHLGGKSCGDIMALTGYKQAAVYRILNDQRVVQMRQQLLKETEKEFEALYPKAVDNLRLAMHSEDVDEKLKSTDMYLRAAGKYQKQDNTNIINVTAEDVVFQILNQKVEDPSG